MAIPRSPRVCADEAHAHKGCNVLEGLLHPICAPSTGANCLSVCLFGAGPLSVDPERTLCH